MQWKQCPAVHRQECPAAHRKKPPAVRRRGPRAVHPKECPAVHRQELPALRRKARAAGVPRPPPRPPRSLAPPRRVRPRTPGRVPAASTPGRGGRSPRAQDRLAVGARRCETRHEPAAGPVHLERDAGQAPQRRARLGGADGHGDAARTGPQAPHVDRDRVALEPGSGRGGLVVEDEVAVARDLSAVTRDDHGQVEGSRHPEGDGTVRQRHVPPGNQLVHARTTRGRHPQVPAARRRSRRDRRRAEGG